jgi:glycine/sarcosine N-methyltransferase
MTRRCSSDTAGPAGFYDALADDYHLLFEDWQRAITVQAGVLDRLFARLGVPAGGRVLDAACGIGTQTLGLAGAGYRVTASDLSAAAVERARHEAAARTLDVAFAVADMRSLDTTIAGGFDAVIALDNAFAHMLTDHDLAAASRGLASRVTDGGLVAVSVRPYDQLARERPVTTHPRVSGEPPARRVSFQLWRWHDNRDVYDADLLTLFETADGWQTRTRTTTLRALSRERVVGALRDADLRDVSCLEPDTSGYYQPVIVGWRTTA